MTKIIRNIDLYCDELEKIGGYLVILDQEKAFDRVNHTYLFELLKKMNIKGRFYEITQCLYKNITNQIQVNGTLTEKNKD